MATLFFGDYINQGVYPNNGNWRDINQWYTNRGEYGKNSWNRAPLAGVFPTTSDTIVCDQAVLSGVGVYNSATSSWTTDNTWPGTVIGLKTGYYTGDSFNNNTGVGIWTGVLASGMIIYGSSASPVIAGPLVYNIPSFAYSDGQNYFYGGFITRGYTSSNLNQINSFIGGNTRWDSTSTLQTASIYIGGRSTVSATSVVVSAGSQLQIFSQTNATYNFSISSAGQVYLYKGTFLGPLTLTTAATLTVGTATIAADISTAAVGGCTRYNFYGGTFTNSAALVLGRPNTFATVFFGQTTFYDESTAPLLSSQTSSSPVITKNLTIYGRPTSNGNPNATYYARFTSGVFTGTLTFIPITGFSSVMISIGESSVYAPTATVPVTTSGTSTTILTANWPADYGFSLYARFRPNIQLTGLPAGTDILSTQLP